MLKIKNYLCILIIKIKLILKTQSKIYQIRFNTHSKNENDRWRLINERKELLVSNVIIDGKTFTTKDWIPEINDWKWHVSCEGYCDIKNGVAYIQTIRDKSALSRHIFKTISYRILGTLTTVLTAYLFGLSLEVSSLLGATELVLKPIIYFLHERIWFKYVKLKKDKK